MDSTFLKDFDTILNEILVDYRAQFPDADTSIGTLIYIKSACMASALWGLYRYQEWISDQIFPDTADADNMEHHAWIQGIERRSGETDAQLLARDLDNRRQPPAGGNQYDYVKWALEVDGVADAYCIPLAQGLGSVDVVIVADNDSGVPDQDMIDDVFDYIEDRRPVGMRWLRVMGPTDVAVDITLEYSGDADADVIEADINAFISDLIPGESLILSQLSAVLISGNSLTDLTISAPAANVTAESSERITAGEINVIQL